MAPDGFFNWGMRISRHGLWLALVAVFALAANAPAFAQTRVALVIGNASYATFGTLPNPGRDAAAMGDMFKAAGFDDVRTVTNLGIADMRKELRGFSEKAAKADFAVLFYAGHGIEVGGRNYLIPVDATLARDLDVEDEAIDLDRILQLLEPAKRLKLVILDACRDNPFVARMQRTSASRSVGRGLGMAAPQTSNTLVAYAARAGSTAQDGDAQHSPFTTALLHHLTTPGLDLRIALGDIHDEVLAATGGGQEPFVYGAVGGGTLSLTPSTGGAPKREAMLQAPPSSALSPAPATECDRLAARPSDPDEPASVPGVDFARIDTQQAIPACRAALEQYPQERRLTFALGRALEAAKQYDEAMRLYRKSADAGNARAMANLGKMYADGRGAAKNEAEALRLFRKAADVGDTLAIANLGFMYANGRGVAKDETEAVRLFRKAADSGNVDAMTALGWMYHTGQGVKKDEGEAARLSRKAADGGNVIAVNNLGTMYQAGLGVRKDEAEAVRLYRKAADAGSPLATFNLGFMYENGLGVAKDEHEAARLYRKAADAGHAAATRRLGAMYENGRGGLKRDKSEARQLYKKAADLGDNDAQKALAKLR